MQKRLRSYKNCFETLIHCICLFAHGWARSDVQERVVWVDTTKTKVKDKEGKLKEKETTVLEVSGDNSVCCLTAG